MSEPSLEEKWKRVAEVEHSGNLPEERDFKIFEKIAAVAEKNPELKDFFIDLKALIVRYGELAADYERKYGTELIEQADESKRRAHEALIDNLNILSRQFAKAGLDNTWRKNIGDSREQVSEWAKNVAETLKQNK